MNKQQLRNSFYNHLARNILFYAACVILAIVTAVFFCMDPLKFSPFFSQGININRAVVFVLLVGCLMVLPYRIFNPTTLETPRQIKYRKLFIFCYTLVAFCALVMVLFPDLAANLVRKEDWPFYRNAIFIKATLQIIAAIFFIKIALHYYHHKQILPMIIAAAVSFVLFFIAGEEFSWGQRLVGWNTPDFLIENNEQGEFNLHNLSTQLFQNSLYFAGWLLLIALPFWSNLIKRALTKLKLKQFTNWLPEPYFIMLFAPAFAIADPLHSETGLYYSSNLFIVVATFMILVYCLIKSIRTKHSQATPYCVASLFLFITMLITSQFLSRVWDVNPGATTEYLEIFIALGFMLWAKTTYSQIKQDNYLLLRRIISDSAS